MLITFGSGRNTTGVAITQLDPLTNTWIESWNVTSGTYRTAGNFQGRKLWRIGGSKKFVEKTFMDCLASPLTCGCGHRFSQKKLSLIDPKP